MVSVVYVSPKRSYWQYADAHVSGSPKPARISNLYAHGKPINSCGNRAASGGQKSCRRIGGGVDRSCTLKSIT